MARIYLGLGSNIDRERHVRAGLDALVDMFDSLEASSVYDAPAMGFAGDAFLNLVVRVSSDLPVGELAGRLRSLEYRYGRPQRALRNTPRRLDIDILTYDDLVGEVDGVELPRGEILRHAFVLRPLAELAPDDRHPVSGEPYSTLWSRFDSASQPVSPVPFVWRGRELSRLPG